MRFISIGIAAGIILLLALSRVLGHYLYHVRSIDPLTYITIGLVVLIAGSLAILIPARQVMKVDPIAVLHAE